MQTEKKPGNPRPFSRTLSPYLASVFSVYAKFETLSKITPSNRTSRELFSVLFHFIEHNHAALKPSE